MRWYDQERDQVVYYDCYGDVCDESLACEIEIKTFYNDGSLIECVRGRLNKPENKLKTIFDYQPSKRELDNYAHGYDEDDYNDLSIETKLQDLCYMLHGREDETYKEYLNHLPGDLQTDFLRTIHHP